MFCFVVLCTIAIGLTQAVGTSHNDWKTVRLCLLIELSISWLSTLCIQQNQCIDCAVLRQVASMLLQIHLYCVTDSILILNNQINYFKMMLSQYKYWLPDVPCVTTRIATMFVTGASKVYVTVSRPLFAAKLIQSLEPPR